MDKENPLKEKNQSQLVSTWQHFGTWYVLTQSFLLLLLLLWLKLEGTIKCKWNCLLFWFPGTRNPIKYNLLHAAKIISDLNHRKLCLSRRKTMYQNWVDVFLPLPEIRDLTIYHAPDMSEKGFPTLFVRLDDPRKATNTWFLFTMFKRESP